VLAAGVVIETTQQRSGAYTVAATLPCTVELLTPSNAAREGFGWAAGGRDPPPSSLVRFVLQEGRHRQIRKMVGALGGHGVVDLLRVKALHRCMGTLLRGAACSVRPQI
jgi:16S rRNA U516 pseudouridylate synthase RsuA-like enzyme